MPLKKVHSLICHRMREWAFDQAENRQRGIISQNPDLEVEAQKLQTLRMLSFNIQVGITTQQYGHYLTRSWQHILPVASRQNNLDRIARLIHEYDFVALQEVDGGSIRYGRVEVQEPVDHG